MTQTYEVKASRATVLLDEAFDNITGVLALPLKYWKRLRTINVVERLNQEICQQLFHSYLIWHPSFVSCTLYR
ncbi:MAG: hypothetical protein GX054_05610 [Clostridiales bacterium]|nr:hypothetical protein [Clostridiales bacterium]